MGDRSAAKEIANGKLKRGRPQKKKKKTLIHRENICHHGSNALIGLGNKNYKLLEFLFKPIRHYKTKHIKVGYHSSAKAPKRLKIILLTYMKRSYSNRNKKKL